MKAFCFAVLALLCLSASARAECQIPLDTFMQRVAKIEAKMFTAKPDALVKLVAHINKNREKQGREKLEADLLIVGHMNSGGMPQVGLAMSYKGCIVPEMTVVLDPEMFVRILISAGLSADDLVPMANGVKA
jgi:hypothetical protein